MNFIRYCGIGFSIVIAIFLLAFVSNTNQKKDLPLNLIPFSKDSFELSNRTKFVLDSTYQIFFKVSQKKGVHNFFEQYRLILYPYSCQNEYFSDSLIGYKRCIGVVKYFEDTYKVDKSNFFYSAFYNSLGPDDCSEVGVRFKIMKK